MDDIIIDSQDLAEERTNLALERTILAKERTFSAWIRTGLAAVAAGLGIAQVLDIPGMSWIVRLIGAILIVMGGSIYIFAFHRYNQSIIRLWQEDGNLKSSRLLGILTAGLVLVALLALILLLPIQ